MRNKDVVVSEFSDAGQIETQPNLLQLVFIPPYIYAESFSLEGHFFEAHNIVDMVAATILPKHGSFIRLIRDFQLIIPAICAQKQNNPSIECVRYVNPSLLLAFT